MKHGDVFEVLEPPVGGLTRFRARLDERRRRPVRWLVSGVLASAVAVAVLVLSAPRQPRADFSAAVAQLREVGGTSVIGLGESAVEVVPGSNGAVVFARVSSLSSKGEAP